MANARAEITSGSAKITIASSRGRVIRESAKSGPTPAGSPVVNAILVTFFLFIIVCIRHRLHLVAALTKIAAVRLIFVGE